MESCNLFIVRSQAFPSLRCAISLADTNLFFCLLGSLFSSVSNPYSPINQDQLSTMTLTFQLSTKSAGFEKKKNKIGDYTIDFSGLLLSHTNTSIVEADLGSGYFVTIMIALSGASLLAESILSSDNDSVKRAIQDMKRLVSDPQHLNRIHEYLSHASLIDNLLTLASQRFKKKQKSLSDLDDEISDLWHKLFEISVFARVGQHLGDAPLLLFKLISDKPKSIFKGNLILKTLLLDALKHITGVKPGIALLPSFCEFLASCTTLLTTNSNSVDSKETSSATLEQQRFVTTILRILISFDPKYISWMIDNGDVLPQISYLLQHWSKLDVELLKQNMELLKFFGSGRQSELDKHQFKDILQTITSNCADVSLEIACHKVLQQLWQGDAEEFSSSIDSLISSFRDTNNATSRLALSEHLLKYIKEVATSKEKLLFVLKLVDPARGSFPLVETDTSLIMTILDQVTPNMDDILDSQYFFVLARTMKTASSPVQIVEMLFKIWQESRPESWSLRTTRNGPYGHPTIPSSVICGWSHSKFDHIIEGRLSKEEIAIRDKEQSLLLESSFFHSYRTLIHKDGYKECRYFVLFILWHQTSLFKQVLAEDPDFIKYIVQSIPEFKSGKITQEQHCCLQAPFILLLMALQFEANTDRKYQTKEEVDWTVDWATSPSTIAQIVSQYNDALQNTIQYGFESMMIDTMKNFRSNEVDSVLALVLYEIVKSIRQLNLKYDWTDFHSATEGEMAIAKANWKKTTFFFNRLFERYQYIFSRSYGRFGVFMNFLTMMDHTWTTNYFHPLLKCFVKINPEFSIATDQFNLPLYVDPKIYPHDSDRTKMIYGSHRVALAVALRNFLTFFRFDISQVDETSGLTPQYLNVLWFLLQRLDSAQHGKICLNQMIKFWLAFTESRFYTPNHYAVTMLYSAVLKSFNEVSANLESGKSNKNDSSSNQSKDEAVLPCDHISFIPPSIIYILVQRSMEMFQEGFSYHVIYEKLQLMMIHLPKLRFSIILQCSSIRNTDSRWRKDFEKFTTGLKTLTSEQIEAEWPKIEHLLDLFYVPHHLYWFNSTFIFIELAFKAFAHLTSRMPAAPDPTLHLAIETILDILIVLPLNTFNNDPIKWMQLLICTLTYPHEQIQRKVAWIVRRYLFGSTHFYPWNQTGCDTFDQYPRYLQYNLKYPSALAMMARSGAWAKRMKNSDYFSQSTRPVTEELFTVQHWFNAFVFYREELSSLLYDPKEYILRVQSLNEDYVPICSEIVEDGSLKVVENRPMFDVHEKDDGKEEKKAKRRKRLNFVPLGAVLHFQTENDPKCPKNNIHYRRYEEFLVKGYAGHMSGSQVIFSFPELPKARPMFFDEYPIYESLPEEDRTLSERDLQFAALFDDCLMDDRLLESETPEALKAANEFIASSGIFPDLTLGVLYKNHLIGWVSERYFVPFVQPTPKPETNKESVVGESVDDKKDEDKNDGSEPPKQSSADVVSSSSSSSLSLSSSSSSFPSSDDDVEPMGNGKKKEDGNVDNDDTSKPTESKDSIDGESSKEKKLDVPVEKKESKLDQKRMDLMKDHFTRQLLDTMEAICDALFPLLVNIAGQFVVRDASTCLDPAKTHCVMDREMLSLDPLMSFIHILIENPFAYNVFTHDRIKFRHFIPVSMYWKWLGCMAQLAKVLPHPFRVFCGKLTSALMKHDIESGLKLAESIGEPLFIAVAEFGGMSSNPKINPSAPRMLSSKSSTHDPKDNYGEVNTENEKISTKMMENCEFDKLVMPSSTFYFERLEQVPSYLIHYLPLLLDAIERQRQQVGTKDTRSFYSMHGSYRCLVNIVPLMIAGCEANCFQLAQFALNQYYLAGSMRSVRMDGLFVQQQLSNIIIGVVKNCEDVDRLMKLRAHKVPSKKESSLGSSYPTFATFLHDSMQRKTTVSTAAGFLALVLRHFTTEMLEKHFWTLAGSLQELVAQFGTVSTETKMQLAVLPIIPWLLSKVDDALLAPMRNGFVVPLCAPHIFLTTLWSHYRVSRNIADSWALVTHRYMPLEGSAVAAATIRIMDHLQSNKLTYIRSLIGDDKYDPFYHISTIQTPILHLPAHEKGNCFTTISTVTWLVLSYLDQIPALPVDESMTKKWIEWVEEVFHVRPPPQNYAKEYATVLKANIIQFQQGLQEIPSSMKSNGRLWRISSLNHLPIEAKTMLQFPSHPHLPIYGMTVVDRIGTVWFEDRGIKLPSKISQAKQAVTATPNDEGKGKFASSMHFFILPFSTSTHGRTSPSTFARIGYASKNAIDKLTANPLLGLGDVEESWAADEWEALVLSEGSAWNYGSKALDCETRPFTNQKPITLSYDAFTNSICISSLIRVPWNNRHESPTQAWIPLPSNRPDLTIYPCISFYSSRRFIVEPISHLNE
jgi:hypothetical protein